MWKLISVSERSEWLQDLNSFLASAVCHLTAFIALGLLSLTAERHGTRSVIEVQLGTGNDPVVGEEGQLAGGLEVEGTSNTSAVASAIATDTLLDFQPVDSATFDRVEVPLAASLMAGDISQEARALDRALAKVNGRGGRGKGNDGQGTDAWSGEGSPWGKEKGFFGIGDSGKSLVYVVDCSDSMNDDGKFARTCAELLQAIELLTDKQRYFIIFFNSGAYPMDADGPVAATSEQVDRTRRWIKGIVPGGGTNPLPALSYALSLQPDAIYFLSDGKFDPLIIQEIKGQNHSGYGRVPIHTISFVNRESIGIMRMISRHSGGKFQFVK